MKTKTLRLPMLFASAGAIICTVSTVRAADAALEVREDRSTTQKEVINEPSGADRTYSTRVGSDPSYSSSYSSRTYQNSTGLDPDTEGDRTMHMYQRGRHAAESLDRQIKPNPIVVLPATTTFESSQTTIGRMSQYQQHASASSSFNEPAAAERETTTSTTTSTTGRRYTTSGTWDNSSSSSSSLGSGTSSLDSTAASSSTAMLGSGGTIKASDLIGMNIKSDQGERIGEIKDFVVDLKSGRVAYAVVSAGGIAGLGDKWLAVPPSVFTRTGSERTLTWNVDQQKLRSAPTIDKHNWNAAYQPEYIGKVYSFYGVENPEQDSNVGEPAGSQKKNDSQDSQKQDGDQSKLDSSSSDLKGQASASTESSQQRDLQKSEPEKSASASSSSDVSKEAAGAQASSSSAPSSSSQSAESKSSADVSSPSQSSSATEPQSGTSVSESSGATTTTTDATASMPDKVQMALKNDASLSTAAQDVKFSMENDKLVIKGNVKSEDEKNRIMEKVRATAGSTEIDDQLKVGSSSDTQSSDESK
jgi:sporulation protein YlmC with PRC-barrel domain